MSTLPPGTTIQQACVLMKSTRASAFVIVDEAQSVIGILSEQDIVRRVVAQGLDPSTTQIASVMTLQPVTLPSLGKPHLEDEAAMALMAKGNFRHVPIVDHQGRFLRAVDVIAAASASISRRPSLVEAMTRTASKFMRLYKPQRNEILYGGSHIPSCELVQRASVTIAEAARFLQEKKLSAVLVETKYGSSGIVTESDICRRCVAEGLNPSTTTLAEIMTPNPTSVGLDTQPKEALMHMVRKAYRHLPVKSPQGELVMILDVLSVMRTAHNLSEAAAVAPAVVVVAATATGKVAAVAEPSGPAPQPAPADLLSQDEAEAAASLVAGNFKASLEALDRAVARSSAEADTVRLRARRGAVRSVVGDGTGALEDFEFCLAQDNAAGMALHDEARVGACEVLSELGRFEQAVAMGLGVGDEARRAKCIEALEAERESQKQTGKDLFTGGHMSDAITSFTNALRIHQALGPQQLAGQDRTRAVLHANRAACYMQQSFYQMAADDCHEATRADPSYDKAWIRWCSAQVALGKPEDAAQVAKRGIEALGSDGDEGSKLTKFLLVQSSCSSPEPRQEKPKADLAKIKGLGLLFAQGLQADNVENAPPVHV